MTDARDLAVRTLKDEHRTISAVLHGLRYLAQQSLDAKVQPDFSVFHAMIHYIDEFPERLHHPKEEKLLFARLAIPAARLVERGIAFVRPGISATVRRRGAWPSPAR